jgi:formamidopyrimidine-DNA glycosylase
MPELPEVELVARSLDRLVAGRRIAAAELRRARLAPHNPPEEFAAGLGGALINSVGRRGKHLLFDLDNGRTLVAHLRMTGRFMLLPVERELPKYAHAVFYFADEMRLVFEDQRHFGFMRLVATGELYATKELKTLAPEPFSDDFTADYLYRTLKTSRRSLKEFLLDQTKVLGLGNIYASEAMFLAGLDPRRAAAKVSKKKAAVLFEQIRAVLAESIAHGSTLNVDPENIDGSYYGGGYESRWRVYDRELEPCASCESPIARIVQAGRSTYFCPSCQQK